MNIASRMAQIAPFHVMELMAKAQALEAAGRSIVHFEVGEPAFATAEPIIAAAHRFLAGGHVHYTAALGLPALREAIAAFYQRRYGVSVAAERIVVTAGASGALLLALGALVSPGDEWLLPDPGYPCNRHFMRLVEGIPVAMPVGAATGYQPTSGQVQAAWSTRTRGVMLASPSNPTGTLLDRASLDSIWREVRTRGGNLIVDEIYHGLTYGLDAETALSISDDIFVINSFSKYFGMTGWRLGWLVVPPGYARAVEKLAQNLFICASTVAQHAALAAFETDTIAILETRRAEFAARRDILVPGLRQLGFDIPVDPRGAFYAYANVSTLSKDSFEFAERLLADAGVAATPGVDFGDHRPREHMRFSYTVEQSVIEEGLDRLRRFLGG
jgi:aspartate/methionine/tyrosine aminotransferase